MIAGGCLHPVETVPTGRWKVGRVEVETGSGGVVGDKEFEGVAVLDGDTAKTFSDIEESGDVAVELAGEALAGRAGDYNCSGL